jgi:hypothetical protein
MIKKLFAVGQKQPKGIADFRYKGSLDVFEQLNSKLNK